MKARCHQSTSMSHSLRYFLYREARKYAYRTRVLTVRTGTYPGHSAPHVRTVVLDYRTVLPSTVPCGITEVRTDLQCLKGIILSMASDTGVVIGAIPFEGFFENDSSSSILPGVRLLTLSRSMNRWRIICADQLLVKKRSGKETVSSSRCGWFLLATRDFDCTKGLDPPALQSTPASLSSCSLISALALFLLDDDPSSPSLLPVANACSCLQQSWQGAPWSACAHSSSYNSVVHTTVRRWVLAHGCRVPSSDFLDKTSIQVKSPMDSLLFGPSHLLC